MGVLDLYLRYQRAVRGDRNETVSFRKQLENPRRVTVLIPGDDRMPAVVVPALRLLRAHHPDVRIVLVAGPDNIDAIRKEKMADKSIVFHRKRGTTQIGEIKRVAKEVAKLDPELLLLFDPEHEPSLLALAEATGTPLRVGFGDGDRYPYLNFQLAPPEQDLYLADAFLKLVGAITGEFVDFLDDRVRLRIPEADVTRATRLLHFWQPKSDKLLFAIEPPAGARDADIQKYAGMARLLVKAYDARIMVLTEPSEKTAGEALEQRLGAVEPYRAPVEGMHESIAFLSRVDLFVGPNAPLFHHAVAMGTPAVGLFTESDAAWWYPPNDIRARALDLGRKMTEETFLKAVQQVGSPEDAS